MSKRYRVESYDAYEIPEPFSRRAWARWCRHNAHEQMIRLSYNQNRVFAGVLLGMLLLSAADDCLELGYFGRFAKLISAACLVVGAVWGAFWAPTRQEMAQHRNKEK